MTSTAWWRDSVGYEVYLRSFADGDDDGIGDLRGLTERLEHLAWLGVDVVWITPFYPSPMADYGYDVADHTDVHPRFGTLDDFDVLVEKAGRLGLRIVIDVVPNHTSDQHPWFQAARSSPDDPKRDYYHWRDVGPDGELPNNWVGYFGGPTWTHDPLAEQHYLHLFLPEQPDLNWANPAVADEFDRILRFWLERGVSGFRIDVAQAMGKDAALRSNPEIAPVDHTAPRWEQWAAFEHLHDVLQPETLEVFARWRALVEEYDAVLIGETYVLEPDELAGLLRGDGLHVGFWFSTMHVSWEPAALRDTLAAPIAKGAADIGWVQASHDEHRPPTRFGGGSRGSARSLGFSTLLMCLPGMPFLYQAEELAIEDGIVPPERKADPIGGVDPTAGRDGCRTPVPWSVEPGQGFSPTAEPWLPSSHETPDVTVAGQRLDPASPLHRVRRLLKVRRFLDADAEVEWIDSHSDLVHFRRGVHDVILNAGDQSVELTLESADLVFSSLDHERDGEALTVCVLAPDEALILRGARW